MKKMNNKGFSLVELIVVVLIMAIIAVALAPQVMKWVENSRKSTDVTNYGHVGEALEIAYAKEQVYKAGDTQIKTSNSGNTKGNWGDVEVYDGTDPSVSGDSLDGTVKDLIDKSMLATLGTDWTSKMGMKSKYYSEKVLKVVMHDGHLLTDKNIKEDLDSES